MNRLLKGFVLCLLASSVLAVPAWGDYVYWTLGSGSGYVTDLANWQTTYPAPDWPTMPGPQVPGDGDLAIIKTPGTVLIDATHAFAGTPSEIWVGDGTGVTMDEMNDPVDWDWPYSPNGPGAGHVLQTGGTVNWANWLIVGRDNAPGASTYDLQGGSVVQTSNGGRLQIGSAHATGTMTISNNASLTAANSDTFIGLYAGANGTLSMSGTSTANLKHLFLGYAGADANNKAVGAINLSGDATMNLTGGANLGVWSHSEGSLTLSDTADFVAAGTLIVGDNWGGGDPNATPGKGTVTMSGDATATTGEFRVGSLDFAEGTLTMSGSSHLTNNAYTVCGYQAAKATVTLSDDAVWEPLYGHLGGTAVFPEGVTPHGDTVNITMNNNSQIKGTYWLNFGEAYSNCTLTMNNNAGISSQSMDVAFGTDSTSTAVMNGTSHVAMTGGVNIGVNGANAHGSLTMNGTSNVTCTWLAVGQNGAGALGELTLNESAEVAVTGAIALADAAGATGIVTMTGDSRLTATSWFAVGNSYGGPGTGEVFMSDNAYLATTGNELEVAWGGTGILHIGDGTPGNAVVSSFLPVILGHGTGGGPTNARIDVNGGGTLECPGIATGNDGAGTEPVSSVLNLDGGTLKATASNADFMTNGGGSLTFQANVLAGGATIDTNGFEIGLMVALTEDPLSTGGGLTKVGEGLLTLGGACSYTGDTAVEEGALAVDGSITSDVTVAANAALLGKGTVVGNVTAAGNVGPGTSIGTLTINGDATIGGTLDVEYDSDASTIDLLAVSGILDLTGATLSFSDLGEGTLSGGPYVFATYGTLTGAPAIEVGTPDGYTVDYAYGGNSIALVPEPALFVLLAGLALALAGCRIRR